MKLLCLTTSYPRSVQDDSSIFVKRLCLALRAKTENLTVLVPHEGESSAVEEDQGLEIHRVKFWPIATSLTFGAGLLENIKQVPLRGLLLPALVASLTFHAIRLRSKFDVVHANWIIAGAAALLTRFAIGKPFILTLRGSEMMLIKNPVVRFLYGPILFGAKEITTVSESLRDELIRYFPSLQPNTHCIPNGIENFSPSAQDLDRFRQSFKLTPNTPYLLAVGSVIPRKRIEKLLALMAHPALNSAHLLVCGKLEHREYYQQLEQLAGRLGVTQRTHFLSAISPNDIGCALRLSRALLTASSFEGRPNAVLEAMTSGLPVIASDIPSHREILQDRESGIIVNFDNIQETVTKTLELMGNRDLRETIIATAKKAMLEQTWERSAERYLTLMETPVSS